MTQNNVELNSMANLHLGTSRLFRLLLLACALALLPLAGQSATVRIMPLGDSITTGLDGQATYRYWLWWMCQKLGRYDVTFVGTQTGVFSGTPKYPNFPQNHEGHPAARTDYLAANIRQWAGLTQPDIVLLLPGAQDIQEGFTAPFTIAYFRRIIGQLRAVNPRIVVIVGLLPPLAGFTQQEASVNTALFWDSRAKSRANSPVIPVNLSAGYSVTRSTVDGVHPNQDGEIRIAWNFYNALIPVLQRFGQRPRPR